jgi:hypothetical protein
MGTPFLLMGDSAVVEGVPPVASYGSPDPITRALVVRAEVIFLVLALHTMLASTTDVGVDLICCVLCFAI